jgi:hypothetical protein
MHAFMAAVLLRVTGLDAFDVDSQPQPPHRQASQTEQSVLELGKIISAPTKTRRLSPASATSGL